MRLILISFALFALILDLSFCAPSTTTTIKSENNVETTVATEIAPQSEESKSIEAVQLSDLADVGADHANEAERDARFLGIGLIGIGGGYGYRPWGYRPWGYGGYGGYGYRPYYRPWGGYGGYYGHYHHGGWNYWG